jgi:cysteine desulfurase
MEHCEQDEARIEKLRTRLENSLVEKIPSVQVNGKGAPRLPNTLNISFHYIEGEGMLFQLSGYGICASSGSACTSGSLEPSHVLRAMKVPFTAIHGSVRFSLSRYTTEDDVDTVLEIFPQIVANLRKLSPYWDNERNAPRADALSLIQQTHA